MRTLNALLAFLALALPGAAAAQEYRFSVPEARVTVDIEKSGSILIQYKLTFHCSPGAHPIDIVDIGMPGPRHSPVSAALDGRPIPGGNIRKSSAIDNGYEVQLPQAIDPGNTGVFEFAARASDMVWQDTTDKGIASFRFSPTWFGERYVEGTTELLLRYRLPPGEYADPDKSVLYQKESEKFDLKGVMDGESVPSVAWKRTVRLTAPNSFGVSFPKANCDRVQSMSIGELLRLWWDGQPEDVRFWTYIILIGLFSLSFFLVSRGTGWSVLLVLLAVFLIGLAVNPAMAASVLLLAAAGLGALYWGKRSGAGKRDYFPAEVCRESGTLRRGLTAVEAAVVLALPLDKVLTMVVFGLAKKGVLSIQDPDPLSVKVLGQHGEPPEVWTRPDGAKVALWPYEPAFVAAFRRGGFVEDMELGAAFEQLIARVRKEMKGFSLEKTREYYRRVVSEAWKRVKAEADYEARFRRADGDLEWLMLEKDWAGSMDGLGGGRWRYDPWWWSGRTGGRVFSSPLPAPSAPPATGAAVRPTVSFGDVANSIAGRLEKTGGRLAGSLDSVAAKHWKGVDLSGFDHFAKDVLDGLASGSGGGGGYSGGGGCACACAGCACACACAGGGR